jgi:hypothetical protein
LSGVALAGWAGIGGDSAGVAPSSGLAIGTGIHAMNAAVTIAQSKAVATLAIHVNR